MGAYRKEKNKQTQTDHKIEPESPTSECNGN